MNELFRKSTYLYTSHYDAIFKLKIYVEMIYEQGEQKFI